MTPETTDKTNGNGSNPPRTIQVPTFIRSDIRKEKRPALDKLWLIGGKKREVDMRTSGTLDSITALIAENTLVVTISQQHTLPGRRPTLFISLFYVISWSQYKRKVVSSCSDAKTESILHRQKSGRQAS